MTTLAVVWTLCSLVIGFVFFGNYGDPAWTWQHWLRFAVLVVGGPVSLIVGALVLARRGLR